VEESLEKPGSPRRTAPLAVAHPVRILHTITLRLPRPLALAPEDVTVDDPAFRFRSRARDEGSTITLSQSYVSLRDHVPPDRLEAYLGHLDEARRHLRHSLDLQARAPAVSRTTALASGLLVFALGLAGWLMRRRRRAAEDASLVVEPLTADTTLAARDGVPPAE
jgi:hypothetical protein